MVKSSEEKARVVKSSISIEWLRTVESSKEYSKVVESHQEQQRVVTSSKG